MEQEMMPEQGGGDVYDAIGDALTQVIELAGPDWALQFLQAGIQSAQDQSGGAGEAAPMDIPPELMSAGGPEAMGGMAPATDAVPRRGMMGRRIP